MFASFYLPPPMRIRKIAPGGNLKVQNSDDKHWCLAKDAQCVKGRRIAVGEPLIDGIGVFVKFLRFGFARFNAVLPRLNRGWPTTGLPRSAPVSGKTRTLKSRYRNLYR